MNEMLIKNYNDRVGIKDLVYFVGDVCMGRRDETLPLVKRLNGFKVLAGIGNHDYNHPMHDDGKLKYKAYCTAYEDVFDDIIYDKTYQYEDFLICHFPYGTGGADYQGRDFSKWEPVDEGMPLLCGHVHDSWKTKLSEKQSFMLNVGVDVHSYAPISFEEIKAIYLQHYR